MTAFSPQVRTLDVTSLAGVDMSERDVSELRSLLRHLASCSMGQALLNVALDRRVVIRLVDLDELDWGTHGMVGGFYSTRTNMIALSKRTGRDQQLSTLAHELQHFVDHAMGWSLGSIQCEVRANQSQALVIQQLRLDARCYGLTKTGALNHPDVIADMIRGTHLYRDNTEELPRYDGRVHPLIDADRLLPPAAPRQLLPAGGGLSPVGAISMAPVQMYAPRDVSGPAAATAAASPLFATGAAAAPSIGTAWVSEPSAAFAVGDRYAAAIMSARG